MKYIFIQILVLFIIPTIIFPSNIDSIKISGNFKTNSKLILKSIHHPINIPFQEYHAQQDIQRLLELNIFDDVSFNHYKKIYHIIVKEKKTTSLNPLIDKIDGLGWSAGVNINLNNIKGTLNNIDMSFTFGAINTQKIKYNKKNTSIEYINHKLNSIESDYIQKESIFNLFYNFKNNLYIQLSSKNNNLNYQISPTLKFDFFNTTLHFMKSTNDSFIKTYLSYNFSNKQASPNYGKLFFKFDKHLFMEHNNINSKILFRTQLILNTFPENLSLDFENLYLGGDDFVRGYNPNPQNNPLEVSDYLKFRNMIFQSIQLEIPINKNKYFNSNFILFNDVAIGSNNYKKINIKHKITGHGFGISVTTIYQMRFDICVGLNKYGTYKMHFMKDINF